MAEHLRSRPAREVFEDHLRSAGAHSFEEDIERNFPPDCVVLERHGTSAGERAWQSSCGCFAEELPDAPYTYTNSLVDGRVAFLEWTAGARTRACATGRTRSSSRTRLGRRPDHSIHRRTDVTGSAPTFARPIPTEVQAFRYLSN